jgi:hypothetical protein
MSESMSYDLSVPLRRHVTWLATVCFAVLGCDAYPRQGPRECPFVVNLALLSPSFPQLHIGDTLTMHVKSWAPVERECLPPDTTAAGLRWWTDNGVVAIDPKTGHVTALRPGGGAIVLSQVGDDGALGQTYVGVYYPPSADTVVTLIRNHTGDSAWVVLQDATGAVQRAQTVGPRDSASWVTRISDSVRYSVTIRPPPLPPGSDSSMARWVTPTFAHTWFIDVDSVAAPRPGVTVILGAVSPDPGTGC